MAGIDNDVIFGSNVDFRGVKPVVGQMTTDGDLLIGSTAAPHIKKGTLTSTGGTVAITYVAGNLNLEVVAAGSLSTLTADVGGVVTNVAGNIDVQGTNVTLPTDSIITHNFAAAELGIENLRWQTAYIVDPSATVGSRGTYSTIQTAITAAASAGGGNIFIRPGSYTENLTFSANVNLFSMLDGRLAGNAFDTVTIIGSHVTTYNGSAQVEGIIFLDNGSDPIFSIAHAANSPIVEFRKCTITSAVGTCIHMGQNGTVKIYECVLTGQSVGIEAVSTGNSLVYRSTLEGTFAYGIDASGSSTFTLEDVQLTGLSSALRISSAGASGSSRGCTFNSAGSGIDFVAAGAWRSISDVYSAASGVSGAAGTLSYADIVFISNTTIAAGITQTVLNWRPYATTTTVGTASFNSSDFSVTNGAVSLVNPFSPFVFSDVTATTLAINHGYFATAAGTYNLPATAAQGDLIIFLADTAGAIVLQLPALNFLRDGANITSSGGTATNGSIGDSLTLRYRAATLTWEAVSVIGTWILA